RGLPGEDVGAAVDETLVLRLPAAPPRAARVVRQLDRAGAVGDRVRRIGDVAVIAGGGGRLSEGEDPIGVEVEVLPGAVGGRPLVEFAPLVGAGVVEPRLGEVAIPLV